MSDMFSLKCGAIALSNLLKKFVNIYEHADYQQVLFVVYTQGNLNLRDIFKLCVYIILLQQDQCFRANKFA